MESVSRLSSMLETARDLTIEAAQSAGSTRGYGPRSVPRELNFTQVRKLLESRFDKEVLDGLRKVISMMYHSNQSLPYFSAVVKNVASPNVEIKKLVYIYILHHAESEPDLALLSINAIQKSLSDQNPQVRALALRVMSGIRVPVISAIVTLAIKKGCGDMSPLVRKAAALAIPKCYRLDPSTLPQLLDYITQLLGDKQYFVVGSAVTAFLEVCPERIDLIHKHYRSLVKQLIDMDEWGQLAMIKLMTYYARKCFPRRPLKKKGKSKEQFYDDQQASQGCEKSENNDATELDPDLKLYLDSCKPLLNSRNAAVVIAVTRSFLYLGTPDYLDFTAGPLVALLRSPHDLHELLFYNIVSVCLCRPTAFVPYSSHFLVKATDSISVLRLKLELLTLLFPQCDESLKGLILSELEHFTKSDNRELVQESVRSIGRCAQSDSRTSKRCMNILLQQAASPDEILIAEALTVVRHLIQQDPSSHEKTIIRLAKNLDSMINPKARASIIWLVGEYASPNEEDDIAPDVLRILLQNFADEAETTKLQIALLGAKVYLRYLNRAAAVHKDDHGNSKATVESESPTQPGESSTAEESPLQSEPKAEHRITQLWQHLLLLVRYDTSYDLRDRARMYAALLENPSSTQLASLMLLAPKPAPHVSSPSEGRRNFLLGSATLAIGPKSGPGGLRGYEPLQDWVQDGDEPDPALRDTAEARNDTYGSKARPAADMLDIVLRQKEGASVSATSSAKKNKTLDDWLAEDEGGPATEAEESEEDYEEEEGEGSDEYETETEDEEEEEEEEEEGDEFSGYGKGDEGRILLK
ncbi:MAG: hypothetical protein LQ340_006236 [Diploschistes diacapsis]|nr:MAG: hypothetical protein LQ340_006236 [Diploschistes diacapsis]